MVSFEDIIKRRLFAEYDNIKNVYSIGNREQKQELIANTLIAEAFVAYKVFKGINGSIDGNFENFFDKYFRNNEKRHEDRAVIGSIIDGGKYEDLTFKFAEARSLMRSVSREERNIGLNYFQNALFETSNLVYS